MSAQPFSSSSAELVWWEVGEPPSAVEAARKARLKGLLPIFSAMSGLIIGILGGFAAIALWPGAMSWTLQGRVELFGGVAIAVGAASSVWTRLFLPWLVQASVLRIRRIAVSGLNVRIEQAAGRTYDFPLARISVSLEPVAQDWYSVSMRAGKVTTGKVTTVFYVPGMVAAQLRSRLPS